MSNKKTLLNEGTIRRFMKLANMDNLAESYLDKYDVEEGMRPAKDDDEEEPAMRDLDEEEEMELDMSAEEGPAEEGGADEAMVKKLVDAIAGAIEQETGVAVSVEGDDAPEADMGDMGGEEEVDLGGEMDDEAAMRDEPAMRDLDEEEDFDAYIAEVTRRVAKRIIKSKISK